MLFLEWLLKQKLFHDLYSEWVLSNYDKLLKPSCDRLDEKKPYSFNNIELKTYGENLKEAYKIACSGERNGVSVSQFTLDGILVKKYRSIAIANRETGINNIFAVCSYRRNKAGGYIWRYTDEK